MKFLKYFLLALTVVFSSACLAQNGGTIPTLENGPWVWQGINIYTPGNLQLTSLSLPAAQDSSLLD